MRFPIYWKTSYIWNCYVDIGKCSGTTVAFAENNEAYLLEFIDGNDRFIGNIMRSDSGSYVCGILMEQIRRRADERLRQEEREDVRTSHAMLSATFAGAIVGCGIWWAKQEEQPDKETVIRQFGEFISRM